MVLLTINEQSMTRYLNLGEMKALMSFEGVLS